MTRKEQKHIGQLPLVSEYDEQAAEDRHRGMPALCDVKSETRKLGLPDTDAEAIYDSWLVSGFKTARGLRIASWKAAIRIWNRNGYFPSQKKNPVTNAGEMTNSILDALSENPAYKKVDVQAEAWKFAAWCKENDHKPLVTSFVKFLNAKL
jgi:hypothetical protein